MRQLRLTAVSEDGAFLILTDGDEQFAVRADERLQAAIRGDRARLGQLDVQLESQLRPRDIQARIRAGESVESVAAAATMPLEKVERYAGPVLAEREHVADRARQAHLKRFAGEGPPRSLEAATVEFAAEAGAEPDSVDWDAWRAEDGRWRIRCAWTPSLDPGAPGADDEPAAVFSFEPSGRSVIPQDLTARLISGEPRPEPEPVIEPEEIGDGVSEDHEFTPGPPRLSVVANTGLDNEADTEPDEEDDELPAHDEASAGEPVARLVPDAAPEPLPVVDAEPAENTEARGSTTNGTAAPTDPVARKPRRNARYGRAERRRREPELWSDDPEDEVGTDRLRLSDIATHVEVDGPDDDQAELAPTAQEAPPSKTRNTTKSRRPTVPTWDEIMFGRRNNE